MEAGIEHFGRGIDEAIDKVILVVEPSFESVNVAEKTRDLAGMNKEVTAVLNKIPSEKVAKKLEEELRSRSIEIIGTIPNDPSVLDACLEGRMLDQGKAFHAAGGVLAGLLSEKQHLKRIHLYCHAGRYDAVSPVRFHYGVHAFSGKGVVDADLALRCISQGMNFRRIGTRRVTMLMG